MLLKRTHCTNIRHSVMLHQYTKSLGGGGSTRTSGRTSDRTSLHRPLKWRGTASDNWLKRAVYTTQAIRDTHCGVVTWVTATADGPGPVIGVDNSHCLSVFVELGSVSPADDGQNRLPTDLTLPLPLTPASVSRQATVESLVSRGQFSQRHRTPWH